MYGTRTCLPRPREVAAVLLGKLGPSVAAPEVPVSSSSPLVNWPFQILSIGGGILSAWHTADAIYELRERQNEDNGAGHYCSRFRTPFSSPCQAVFKFYMITGACYKQITMAS